MILANVAMLKRARRLAGILRRAPRASIRAARGAILLHEVNHDKARPRPQQPHPLPGELIVSLTSYPPRYATLAATLKCLLSQTMAPDRVILWIAHGDVAALPANVRALEARGLSIIAADDLRSFKKIIPALLAFPNAFIITADDDVFYPATWLEELARAYTPERKEVLCHRAHHVRLNADRVPSPYRRWLHDYAGQDASQLLMPTGVGGVLYAPGRLHAETARIDMFSTMCPAADDLWLYWMGLRAGSTFRRVGRRRDMVSWPSTQKVSLHRTNVGEEAGNDAQMQNLIAHFGFPLAAT